MNWNWFTRKKLFGTLFVLACVVGVGVSTQGCAPPPPPVQAWCAEAVVAYYSWEQWCHDEIGKGNLQQGDYEACVSYTQVTQTNTALFQAQAGAQNGWAPDTMGVLWPVVECLFTNGYEMTEHFGPSFGYHAKDNKTPVAYGNPGPGQKPVSWGKFGVYWALGPTMPQSQHTMAEYMEHPSLAFADGNPCAQAIQGCRSHKMDYLGATGGDLGLGMARSDQPRQMDQRSLDQIRQEIKEARILGTPENRLTWNEVQQVNFTPMFGVSHPFSGLPEPQLNQQ